MSIWMNIKNGARKVGKRIVGAIKKGTSRWKADEADKDKRFIDRHFIFMRRKPGFLVSLLSTTFLFFLIFAFMVGVAGVGAFLGVARGYLDSTPELDLDPIENQSRSSFIYDMHGNLVTEYYGYENRVWVSIDEIPQMLRDAFIAIEDVRFYAHNGIDWKRFFGAAVHNLTNETVQGGSTITQQLIKQTILTPEQSYKRKVQEMYLAMELEKNYSKDQILEWYLNTIPLGGSSYGVKAAAQDYFGKELDELTLQECATLAGVTRNPWANDPRKNIYERDKAYVTCKRTNLVLSEMYENGYITQQQYEDAKLDADHPERNTYTVLEEGTTNDYPMKYFIEYALHEVSDQLVKANGWSTQEANQTIFNGGLHIYTTLDPELQLSTEEAVYNYDTLPRFRNAANSISSKGVQQPQAAAMVMDYHTGELRAIVGGKQPPSAKMQLNRAYQSKLPLGSAIKPMSVYGPFIELQYPGGIIFENIPAAVDGWIAEERPYPLNYEGELGFTGPVDVRTAITKSLNIIAAEIVCERITPRYSAETLINLGFDPDTVTENPSDLALGTYGNYMNDVIGGYGTIANKGEYQEPISVTRVTDKDNKEILNRNNQIKRQVFKESTTYILTDWMQGVVNGGTTTVKLYNEAGQRIPVAGKTGTNNDFRGCYFAGFTPYYVATIWIGHDDFLPEFRTGSTGGIYAAPLWTEIMTATHKNLEPANFYDSAPSDVKQFTVCGLSGKIPIEGLCSTDETHPPVTELFPEGAEPPPEETCDMHISQRICTYSGFLAGPYCPEEAIGQQAMIVLPPESRYQLLTDEELQTYLPGAQRDANLAGRDYNNPDDQQYFCPLHDYDWWWREQRRGRMHSEADTLIGQVQAHMNDPVYGPLMTSNEKNKLNKLINQINDLLESGNKSPPGPGEPYLTELPGFDPDATQDKMDKLREKDQEILDRIDAELATYHTLTITANEGTADGDGKYQEGEEITVTATADAGWHFSTWVGPVDDPGSETTTITMGASNMHITAVFQSP